MKRLGPTRLVLINSGPYDYADVDLTRSGHLVGENNVGKTSLISVLQFLYLADQQQMRFAEPMDITREFYFPSERSFIVFELNTPEGTQCLLIQGLGPAQQHDYARWIYQGPFERARYLEGKRVRNPKEIVSELAAVADARRVKPTELRQALTGKRRRDGLPLLGIVPVRQAGDYEQFVGVFRNLIHLDRVRQHELKQLVIEISRGEIRSTEINLLNEYGPLFEGIRRDTNSLEAFEHVKVSIEEALDADAYRVRCRERIGSMWRHYVSQQHDAIEILGEGLAQAEREKQDLESEAGDITQEDQRLNEAIREVDREIGGLKSLIEQLNREEKELVDRDEAFERQALTVAEGEHDRVKARLHRAVAQDSVERVERRLESACSERERLEWQWQNLETLVATWLLRHYDASTLEGLFGVLNPALLGQQFADDGVVIRDEAALHRHVETLLERIHERRYRDESISISLNDLPDAQLGSYLDEKAMRQRLDDLESAITEDQVALEAARERESLIKEDERLKREIKTIREQLAAFESLQRMRRSAEDEGWVARKDDLEAVREQLEHERKELEERRRRHAARQRENYDETKRLTDDRDEIERRHRELFERVNEHPERFDREGTLPERLPISVQETAREIEQILNEEEECSRRVRDALQRIGSQPHQSRLMGDGSEAERLIQLRERLEAADEERQALQKRWAGLLKGLSQAAAQLIDGLDVLDRQCHGLNRKISQLAISNLQGLSVRIDRVREIRDQLLALKEQGSTQPELGLGEASDVDMEAARAHVDKALRERPLIRLSDAFELAFDVIQPDGKKRSYGQLNKIQSDGTTVTIKVVMNLLMMRGLMDSRQTVNIPFYLDEVGKLSPNNVQSVVTLARSQDFVPILASPSELEVAEVLYLLRPTARNRLVLTADHRVEVERSVGQANG